MCAVMLLKRRLYRNLSILSPQSSSLHFCEALDRRGDALLHRLLALVATARPDFGFRLRLREQIGVVRVCRVVADALDRADLRTEAAVDAVGRVDHMRAPAG